MNKGSKRITIRIGDEMLDAVRSAVISAVAHNSPDITCVTDYIIKAIGEKLSHRERSAKRRINVKAEKVDEHLPRVFTEEEY
jgi:hypothetical protein